MTVSYPESLSFRLQKRLLPAFRTGHTRYVDFVKENFRNGCRWLDAGGGRKIFHDLYDGERDLVRRAAMVVVCDGDIDSLKDHASVEKRICASLDHVPVASGSFDFITCAMVVEHLPDPPKTFAELSRLLDHGGKLVVHTVNLWSYPTLLAIASKAIPSRLRRRLISRATDRADRDIFPSRYACNTARRMKKDLRAAGLRATVMYVSAGPVFRGIPPLYVLETLLIRLTSCSLLQRFRGQLLVVAIKE